MKEIDVRGYSCPIPVVRTKNAMEENPGEPLQVRVDSAVSRENVSRLARSRDYSVEEQSDAGETRLLLDPKGKTEAGGSIG